MNTGQITNSKHRKRTLPHPTLSLVGLWETEKIELQSNIVLGEIGGKEMCCGMRVLEQNIRLIIFSTIFSRIVVTIAHLTS